MKSLIYLFLPLSIFAQEHIILNKNVANNIKGKYGLYSELNPIALPDTLSIIPEKCLTDIDLQSAWTLMIGSRKNISELPISGAVYKDSIYKYDGELVICRQSHSRTSHSPKEIPALFSFYRANSDTLTWIPNEQVSLGWIRRYNNNQYRCIQSHMTLEGWQPNLATSLWSLILSGCPEWKQPAGAQDAYKIGDCVTFNGKEYTSLINANVWSPSVYPQGWKLK